MKRTAVIILALMLTAALAVPARASHNNDFKVIQNAVRPSPAAEGNGEARWFKVLIQDAGSPQARVKLTLPVALIELVLGSSDARHFKVDDDGCEIDVKAVWTALKKAGRLALVEIQGDDGAIIKVWLE